MQRKGINYDVGTIFHAGVSSRENLDPAVVKHEMQIIKNEHFRNNSVTRG